MKLSDKQKPDWVTVKAQYLAREFKVHEICELHGIAQSTLMQRRLREGWPGRNRSRLLSRTQLISRMFNVLEKQIYRMEIAVMDGADDKEIALLGQLVRTLEKLVDLDTKQKAEVNTSEKVDPKSSKDMTELREKLALRISCLEGE